MAISLGSGFFTVRANDEATQAVRGIGDNVRNTLTGTAQNAANAMGELGRSIVGAMRTAVTEFANTGDEINDMSKKIGFSTESISKWAFALGQSGGSTSTLQNAMRALSNAVDTANQSSAKAADTLDSKWNSAVAKANPQLAELYQRLLEASEALVAMRQLAQDDIAVMQQQGATTEELSGYRQYANELISAQEELVTSLTEKYNKLAEKTGLSLDKIMGSVEVTDAATIAFQRLGLQLSDLNAMNPEQRFMAVANAIAKVEDPMERLALATDLFRGAGMQLMPTLAEGEDGLKKMFDQAERAGVVFTQAEAAIADGFNDALGELEAALKGAMKEVALAVIPKMIELIGHIKESVIAVKDWVKENPELAASIIKWGGAFAFAIQVLAPLATVISGVGTVLSGLGVIFGAIAGAVSLPVIAVVAAVAVIAVAAYALITNWEEVKAFFSELWETIVGLFESGVESIGKFAGWIAQNVVQMFTDPVGFITEYWQGLLDFFDWVWEGMKAGFDWVVTNVFDPVIAKAKEVWDWVAGIFAGGFAEGYGGGEGGTVPGMATGGRVGRGGMAMVGERGPELLWLPRGAEVVPARETAGLLGGGGGGGVKVSVNFGGVTIREEADLDRLVRKMTGALEGVLGQRGLRLA